MDIVEIIVAILSGLAACIPLAVNLIKYVKASVKEKNWSKLLELVMAYIKEAESKFSTGAERKEWVLVMIKATSDTINYDIDMEAVSALIDSLCDLTKSVNAEDTAALIGGDCVD